MALFQVNEILQFTSVDLYREYDSSPVMSNGFWGPAFSRLAESADVNLGDCMDETALMRAVA